MAHGNNVCITADDTDSICHGFAPGGTGLFCDIEQYLIIDIRKTSKALDLSFNTVSAAVKKLIEFGILKETTNAARNRVFAYEEYLNILRRIVKAKNGVSDEKN